MKDKDGKLATPMNRRIGDMGHEFSKRSKPTDIIVPLKLTGRCGHGLEGYLDLTDQKTRDALTAAGCTLPPIPPEPFRVPVVEQVNSASWEINGRLLRYCDADDGGDAAIITFDELTAIAFVCSGTNALQVEAREAHGGGHWFDLAPRILERWLENIDAGPVKINEGESQAG